MLEEILQMLQCVVSRVKFSQMVVLHALKQLSMDPKYYGFRKFWQQEIQVQCSSIAIMIFTLCCYCLSIVETITCCHPGTDFLCCKCSTGASRINERLHPSISWYKWQRRAYSPKATAELCQGHCGGLSACWLDLPSSNPGPSRCDPRYFIFAQAASPWSSQF